MEGVYRLELHSESQNHCFGTTEGQLRAGDRNGEEWEQDE